MSEAIVGKNPDNSEVDAVRRLLSEEIKRAIRGGDRSFSEVVTYFRSEDNYNSPKEPEEIEETIGYLLEENEIGVNLTPPDRYGDESVYELK